MKSSSDQSLDASECILDAIKTARLRLSFVLGSGISLFKFGELAVRAGVRNGYDATTGNYL
jgi:hypothetical protein